MQDHKACVSCLYLIRVEAASYKSKFSLVVNQLEDILPIQNLFYYRGFLKPQKSAIYMRNGAQETQMNIEISQEKLIVLGSDSPSINLSKTNYLWKKTLTSSQTVPFTQTDSYILLHNPTERDIDFKFMVTPTITPLSELEHIYSLDPYQKKVFEYTVPEDAVTTKGRLPGTLDVGYLQAEVFTIFYADAEKNQSMESSLQKGQKVQAYRLPEEATLFPQGATTEPQDFTFQAESAPRIKSNESHAIVEQKFSGKMKWFDGLDKRKYLIQIASPWEFPVEFRLDIGVPLPTYTVIPQIEQWTGDLGSYEMALKTSGNWYFWVYSCDAILELKVEDGDPETAMATIPKGGSYLYKEAIQNGTKRFVVRGDRKTEEKKGKVIIYSSLVDEDNFKSYDAKNDSLEIKVSVQSQEESAQHNITVQFEPIEFTEDLEPSDEIIYQVKLCPERAQQFAEAKFCLKDETCLDYEVRLSVENKEMITVDFQRLREGKYSVKIKATIIHKDQLIKFIQPYTMRFIELKTIKKAILPVFVKEENEENQENKENLWRIVGVIVALGMVVVVSLIGWKIVKAAQENEGEELQSPESSTKGFKPLEDEEEVNDVNEGSEIERNGI